jgi:hypothetical protein
MGITSVPGSATRQAAWTRDRQPAGPATVSPPDPRAKGRRTTSLAGAPAPVTALGNGPLGRPGCSETDRWQPEVRLPSCSDPGPW